MVPTTETVAKDVPPLVLVQTYPVLPGPSPVIKLDPDASDATLKNPTLGETIVLLVQVVPPFVDR
jgi:hypothetical protein